MANQEIKPAIIMVTRPPEAAKISCPMGTVAVFTEKALSRHFQKADSIY